MNPNIETIIKNWLTQTNLFSFESRYSIPITTPPYVSNPNYLWLNFVIEVGGFFLDEKHKKPIKLHHERAISVDKDNTTEQYHEDFKRDLNLLQAEAYASFEEKLKSYDQPIYTSDPLHVK